MASSLDLFAGIPVTHHERAVDWYTRLLGEPPSFLPNDVEAVWELADHRYVFTEVLPSTPGMPGTPLFVDDLDGWVDSIADRGIEPATSETYDNGVRKVTYRDPDGNEIGFGGEPAAA